MAKCPYCTQDIDEAHFKGTASHEGAVCLDADGNVEYDEDDDANDETNEVMCPKCGAVILPNVQGPYDPRIEAFLRGRKT